MVGERRKNPRLGLAIPVRIEGFVAVGDGWQELASTTDVSSGGACFPLSHEVELGQVLLLTLALPKRLRQYDLTEPSYRVYSLVRGVHRHLEQPRVGVMFFGKFAPRGFEERPEARYLLPTDSLTNLPVPHGLREGRPVDEPAPAVEPEIDIPVHVDDPTPPGMAAAAPAGGVRAGVPGPPSAVPGFADFLPAESPGERRSAPRVEVFVNFTIQLVDEWGAVLQEELTVADNVAPGGARVMTTLPFQVGDILLLREASGGSAAFATRAEVRGVTRVQPTIDRLHLRFVDGPAPQRLLRL
jgi:hypothetical protein